VFGVHAILPSQLGPRRADGGVRALLVELLREALRDTGVVPSNAPLHPRRQALAVAWLAGTLDDPVALPIGFVCDALGIDAVPLPPPPRTRSPPSSSRVDFPRQGSSCAARRRSPNSSSTARRSNASSRPCSSPPGRISDDGHQRRQQRAG
jgi:hypothetical protein